MEQVKGGGILNLIWSLEGIKQQHRTSIKLQYHLMYVGRGTFAPVSKCKSDKVRKTPLIHGISRIDLLFMGVSTKINNRCNVTDGKNIEF